MIEKILIFNKQDHSAAYGFKVFSFFFSKSTRHEKIEIYNIKSYLHTEEINAHLMEL